MMLRSAVLALFALVFATQTQAQQYPSGTVKMVVGFAPGGGNDILARILGEKLSAHYNASFIVDNRPGANGIIAIDAVKRAEPNGQNILVGPSSGMTFNPILLKELPYDPVKDFAPIAMVGSFPLLVVVKADSPLKSLSDLVAMAKAKPGAVNFSSAATSFQMATEAFTQRAGIQMLNVPYRGSAPAATAVLTNDVTVNFGDISAVLPLIQGGQLRALAVTTEKRVPSLPDVPTIAESGYPGFEMVFWSGLFLPAGTPEPIRAGLEAEVQKIVAMPDVLDRMRKLGVEASFMPGAALGTKMKSDIEAYRKIADVAGIKPQ
ncbi:tripartite tricarboxylate transporter substrate binding protein [Microbacteriaceae bacterium K1510]|nr:tripartite tricarboxylate transporter substrate binding protein [Microbacteriaceae bacterium K1510]